MKKKKIMFSYIAVVTAVFVCTKTYKSSVPKTYSLFTADIEALTDSDIESYGYFTIHIPQEDKYGNRTGKCSATSFEGNKDNKGPYKTPHNHPMEKCCSRPRN